MYREVKKCRLCGNDNLKDVLDLGNQYLVNFVPEEDRSLPRAPLKIMKCERCQLVQLRYSVAQKLMYDKFWYRSGINEQMVAALRDVVKSAELLVELKDGDKVLDIGCNDSTLLGWYPGTVTTVGVEPCGELLEVGIENQRVDVALKGYFSKDLVQAAGPFKVITAIAMFYDIEDPVQFLKDCKEVLTKDGILIIQMNYLPLMLQGFCVDNVSHEHLTYFSMTTMLEAANRAGLEIVGAETNDVNGGSFRVYITQQSAGLIGNRESINIVMTGFKLRKDEHKMGLDKLETYFNFAMATSERIRILKEYLVSIAKTSKIFVYGASTRGTVLLQLLNLPEGVLQGAAERDVHKYGLRMVGGSWPRIVDEEVARSTATHFLVLPYHFLSQIWIREEEWLRAGGKFIVPLPEPRLLGGDGKEKTLMGTKTPEGVMVQ